MDMENKVIGNCRLVRKIGEGGMGVVYLARHETLQKDVAVKFLPAVLAENKDFVERFLREARAAARLEHPNVIQVLDAGSSNGAHFIIMQFIDGTDLGKIMQKKGKLGLKDALSVTKKVAQALGAAHKLGIVHRDIKPSNIMVTKQGKLMVSDFGLARDAAAGATITTGDQILGTPHYISPEQAEGKKTDGRSDLYSLGAMLYCLLTGRPPYQGETALSIVVKHAKKEEKPEPPSKLNPAVPPDVEALIARMMEKDREKRFQSAEELVAAIDKIRSQTSSVVQVSQELVLTPQKRRRLILIGIGAGIAGLIVLIILLSAVFEPSKAEKAFKNAGAARTDDEKLIRYEEIIEKYPETRWAGKAQNEIDAIHARMLGEELKAIDELAADPETVFGKVIKRLDETREKLPQLAEQLDQKEEELHRARILARTQLLEELVKSPREADHDELIGLINPKQVREHGAGAWRFLIRIFIAGIMKGPLSERGIKLQEIELLYGELSLESRKHATVPVQVQVFDREKREFQKEEGVIEWEWVDGDWYLKEKPKKKKDGEEGR